LLVPMASLGKHLRTLDEVSRKVGGQLDSTDALITATDELLLKSIPAVKPIFDTIVSARVRLMNRRFEG
jgi:hypothetical protein